MIIQTLRRWFCCPSRVLSGEKSTNFTKTIINKQLSLIPNVKFNRQKIINEKYDNLKASTLYRIKKETYQDKKLASLLDQNFINQITPLLLKLTPRELPMISQHKSHTLTRRMKRHVPRLPTFEMIREDPALFHRYIRTITHNTYIHDQNLSILIRTLANPMNSMTNGFQTVDTYNDIMFYFKGKWDLASLRETFKFMRLNGIMPNLKTFNIIISSILNNSRIRKGKDVIIDLKFYLNMMVERRMFVDGKTWRLVYQFLKSNEGKLKYLEMMKLNKVEIDHLMILQMMEGFNQRISLEYIGSRNVDVDLAIMNHMIKLMVRHEKFEFTQGYKFLIKYGNRTNTNDQTLNYFMVQSSNQGRLDLCLYMMRLFELRYNIYGNEQTFELLLKSHVRNGYSAKFTTIYQWIVTRLYKRFDGLMFLPNNYWKLKCQSIIKFNCKNDKEVKADLDKLDCLYDKFQIQKYNGETSLWSMSQTKPEIRTMIRYLNCVSTRGVNSKDKKYITNDSDTQDAKLKYRQQIKKIAINNANKKRLPYIKDWYNALVDEYTGPEEIKVDNI